MRDPVVGLSPGDVNPSNKVGVEGEEQTAADACASLDVAWTEVEANEFDQECNVKDSCAS